ncbi:hypothetical protein [Fibrobacter sp.]|uniref:hypothetical protein n=1 Tax=Fibrobacter sp. TaxID=35828 RepID=UPI0025C1A0AA|nr:hypothetical protein [Fibrobacter sp.]MBR2407176.1 hypothetical protein [Clostridia bacterium]MBR4008502.1 hypothetical protein [Fibrobacter sp.]
MHKALLEDFSAKAMQMKSDQLVRDWLGTDWFSKTTTRERSGAAYTVHKATMAEISPDLLQKLTGKEGDGVGIGTWCAHSGKNFYAMQYYSEFVLFPVPEFNPWEQKFFCGVLDCSVSMFPRWDRDYFTNLAFSLSSKFNELAKGHPSFRALGLFGGIWTPA